MRRGTAGRPTRPTDHDTSACTGRPKGPFVQFGIFDHLDSDGSVLGDFLKSRLDLVALIDDNRAVLHERRGTRRVQPDDGVLHRFASNLRISA